MALVVLLRGVNVGGHRTFRPSVLVKELKHLGAVSIGAAGTFVIRQPVSRTNLRSEFESRLPFDTGIIICEGREVVKLISENPFGQLPIEQDIVRFVSVLSGQPRSEPPMPVDFPSDGTWLLRIFSRNGPFVFGQYRRHMKAISYLGTIDRLFGVPVTTRNWNTIAAIAKVVGDRASGG